MNLHQGLENLILTTIISYTHTHIAEPFFYLSIFPPLECSLLDSLSLLLPNVSAGAPDFDPVSLSSNSSIPLMDGGNTTLSCKLKADSKNWLTVCYGKYNQSFSDFTDESINDKYCTFCFPNSQGKCNLLPPRPEWEVYRTEGGECRDILENDIMIKDFSKNDEGIIVCFYGDDIDPYNLYTTYMLTYMTKTSKSLTVYIIAGAVAILVFVLLFIILAVVYWYRRRRPEPPSMKCCVILTNKGI